MFGRRQAPPDMKSRFRNRLEAGVLLAGKLAGYSGRSDLVVLALPRGGVPVAHAVAQALQAPLDILVVRKLGVPGQAELAMGAIASGGVRVLNRRVVESFGLDDAVIARIAALEQLELARRENVYRGDRELLPVSGKTVILVDDGIATGATVRAALAAVRQRGAGRVVIAAPTIAAETCADLRKEADDVVAVITPDDFNGVAEWYDDFSQTTDAEVRALMDSGSG